MFNSIKSNNTQIKYTFLVGLIFVIIINIPILIMNKNMVAIIHDEFDGDLVAYLYRSRHFFGWYSIDEFLNGMGSVSMVPSSLLFTIPYMVFKPAIAFFVDYILVIFTAYTGMYLSVRKLLSNSWIAVISSVLFILLPFYSVYGLSVMGQPLLLYCFLELWDNKKRIIENYKIYLLIIIFGLSSSLTLIGYADLVIIAIACVYGLIRKKRIRVMFVGAFLLLITYLLTNVEIILSLLINNSDFVSHRTEWIVSPSSVGFFDDFKSIFESGMYHAASIQNRMVYPILAVLVCSFAFIKRMDADNRKRLYQMVILYASTVLIALFYAFWHCRTIVDIRSKLGGIFITFQVDRFYWLYPCLWFVLLAYSLHFTLVLFKSGNALKYFLIAIFCIYNFVFLWDNSSIKENYLAMTESDYRNPRYASVDAFYQEELFSQIDNTINKPKDSYRVISVCLYPSIPLYNGFYCLDGYSNNYDLNYKHEFREIIEEELNRNDNRKAYFDNWGNRCYVFSSEVTTYYPDKLKDAHISSLLLNYNKLKKLGCEYILSGVEIDPCEELEYIDIFDSNDSFYQVFLYRIIV